MTQAMRFDVTAVERASAAFLKVAEAAERLERKLKDLDRLKVEIKPRFDGSAVDAGLKEMRRKVRDATKNLPKAKVEIKVDGLAEAERKVAQLAGRLTTLTGASARVQVDSGDSIPRLTLLTNKVRELQAMSPIILRVSLNSQINVAQIEARIREIERQLARINGNTVSPRVNMDRSWSEALVHVTALGRALRTLAIPAGIAGAAPTVAALGGAALSAVGAVGLLPGALLGAAAAAAGLKVGLSGVGDALKNLDDAKKFAEALKNLAPAAREFATAVKGIAPAWNSVRLDTQQRLFAGLGAEMQKLSSAYLPTVRSGLTGVAGEFNAMAKDFVGFATQTRTVGNVDAIFRNITSALQTARPAAQNLAAAFLDIGVVGSELLPELAGELTDATGRFRTFIDEARRSGELKVWIQSGVDTLKTLGSIAGNVGGTMLAVFAAQRQAGASLLETLDRLTAGMESWARSAEGQRQMVAIFSEIRRTIDAIMPGLQALGSAAMQAVAAFANTGGLVAAGQAFSDIAAAIAPLLPVLGELAGGVVNNLANAFSAVAAVLSPIVSGLSGLLGALGPIPGAVIAMVVAFRLLTPINSLITGLGASLGGLAGRLGASAGAVSGIARTFSALGSTIPYVGVAVVALSAAWDALTVSTDEAARAMDAGGQAAQEAAAGLQAQTFAMESMQNAGGPLGSVLQAVGNAMDVFTSSTEEARAAMTPLQQAQLDAALAANVWRVAVEQHGPASQQASAALEELTAANDRVAAEQETAASAARTHADAIRDLGSSMQSQLGTALAYEDAVKRTGEAHKAANDALKKNGAQSEEYQTRVRDLARAQEQQAQSAQKAAEAQLRGADANTRAKVGLETYNRELLKLNDGTTAGRDAFVKLASNLDNTGLAALSASALMSGLKTEVLTLPDGRTVTVVTSAETAQLESYKAVIDNVVGQTYVGTVTFVGDPTRVNDTLNQVIQFANGQQGTVTLNANGQPAMLTIGQTKYAIDSTTGTLQILGNPAPGEADLSGFKLKIDQTTGTVTFEANPAPVNTAKTEAAQPTDAPVNLQPNTGPVDAAKASAAQPTESPVNLTPNTGPVDAAKTTAAAPTTSPHTLGAPVTDNVGPAKTTAAAPTTSPHTLGGPVTDNVGPAKATASQPSQSLHTLNADDKAVVDAKSRAEQPTSSMHTINVNDSAVADAKRRAQQNTSSTHTIHVVTVGAGPPRAAGAYTTPRAAGAYAAPMAAGGMRSMSSARAEIVPARQPRVIGDRMHGDEAFIPINRSARSMAILNTAAQRMGQQLVPMANGAARGESGAALAAMRSVPSQRAVASGGFNDGRIVAALNALRSEADQAGYLGRMIHEMQGLRRDLRARQGSSADAAESGRVREALGMFG